LEVPKGADRSRPASAGKGLAKLLPKSTGKKKLPKGQQKKQHVANSLSIAVGRLQNDDGFFVHRRKLLKKAP
jgi:hypothetical protein